jgi:NAD(P)H-dependent flavin oxidoreductase YrpB (nitropropane dioxygenase family)
MPASPSLISTPLTKLFGINHPVMLAGMNVAAGPRLAAAVTNAGGIGSIGGLNMSPKILQKNIDELKSYLEDKNAPFGVDLLIPQIGGNARKTNVRYCSHIVPESESTYVCFAQYDYTKGQLPILTDILIKNKVPLFICAVGVRTLSCLYRSHN